MLTGVRQVMNYISVVFSSGSSPLKLPLFIEHSVQILLSCIAKGAPLPLQAELNAKFLLICRFVIQ